LWDWGVNYKWLGETGGEKSQNGEADPEWDASVRGRGAGKGKKRKRSVGGVSLVTQNAFRRNEGGVLMESPNFQNFST